MKLWLDDIRPAPDDTWLVAKTADEAIALLQQHTFAEASLDHDLGHCEACTGCKGYQSSCGCRCHLTGTFVVNWMVTEKVFPTKITTHSMNPIGAEYMRSTLLRYGPYDKVDWIKIPYKAGQK